MSLPVKLWNGSDNNFRDPTATIFHNRGVDDYEGYLSLNKSCLNDPYTLQNIVLAAENFIKHMDSADEISILCDCDPDGYTSAALVYNYIVDYGCKSKVNVLLHTGKQHGLSPEIKVPTSTKLLIIPDAGSNDVEQCKVLHESMDIIVLDHHICDKENPYAIVVNNQMCDYPNKEFSGVGIVYKFLQIVDDQTWSDYADRNLDLVALGNISDVMDMRSEETKYLVQRGLSCIRNPLMEALSEKNSYYIKDVPTIVDVQFYFTPAMNALIRVGTLEQKQRLFDALTWKEESFSYKKRGSDDIINETLAQHVVREAMSCKASQKRTISQAIDELQDLIKKYHWDNNKILFCNASSVLPPALTGIAAIKLADMYNRPCVLLRKAKDDSIADDGNTESSAHYEDVFGGSCRNIDGSPIPNLKEFLESTGEFISIRGHENAAGIQIEKSHINRAIEVSNNKLKDVELKKYYVVDFDLDASELSIDMIRTFYKLRRAWGQGLPEPLVCLRNIRLERTAMHVQGAASNTWKFQDENTGISYIRFFCKQDEPVLQWINEAWDESDTIHIDAVCKLGLNQYKSMVTPQVTVVALERCEG